MITLSTGDSVCLTLVKTDGYAYNLSTWTVRAQIRDPLNVVAGEFTVTVLNAPMGLIRLTLPNPSAVNAIPPGFYVYNVLLYNGSNEDRLPPEKLRILQPVTVKP